MLCYIILRGKNKEKSELYLLSIETYTFSLFLAGLLARYFQWKHIARVILIPMPIWFQTWTISSVKALLNTCAKMASHLFSNCSNPHDTCLGWRKSTCFDTGFGISIIQSNCYVNALDNSSFRKFWNILCQV